MNNIVKVRIKRMPLYDNKYVMRGVRTTDNKLVTIAVSNEREPLEAIAKERGWEIMSNKAIKKSRKCKT